MFESTLFDALSTPGSKWRQFEKDFVWEGRRLVAWKITLLPAGMATSQERANWMRSIRDDVASVVSLGQEGGQNKYYPIKAVAWNYMMVFYESDLHITTSVISSMTTAMISMLVVALILIPEIVSGLLVIFVMSLIDIAVMGFMYYWDVRYDDIQTHSYKPTYKHTHTHTRPYNYTPIRTHTYTNRSAERHT